MNNSNFKEAERIKERYDRRNSIPDNFYNPLKLDVVLRKQELERNLIKILRKNFSYDIQNLKLLEIGCGSGRNLLKFVELGFNPENLVGNELLHDRVIEAKRILPQQVEIIEGNALDLKFDDEAFDIVYQSTVFTSILDEGFKKSLALKMIDWIRPEGGILWYDFIYNNPSNPDVRGITKKEIEQLFPGTEIFFYKITLAPPIARAALRINSALYNLLNFFPLFRTHLLCFIRKV